MLKYLNTEVTFSEIPDEITLCINITGCKNACEGCHSPYLAEDIGTELTWNELEKLIKNNIGISCVCFMGGDSCPDYIEQLALFIKYQSWYPLKVAWYSGKSSIPNDLDINLFNYIKVGPYIPKLGGLDKETTNQIMYKVDNGNLIDITYRFKHDFKSSI